MHHINPSIVLMDMSNEPIVLYNTPVFQHGMSHDLSWTAIAVTVCRVPVTCPSASGYYADPADCHKYYLCSNSTPQHFTCSPGTSWNDSIKNCDWDFNTGCS